MQRRPLTADCVLESTGTLYSDNNIPDDSTYKEEHRGPADESHPSIFRWRIDVQSALEDLRRALRVDALPPALHPIRLDSTTLSDTARLAAPGKKNVHAVSYKLLSDDETLQQDAARLLDEAERMRDDFALSTMTAAEFGRACTMWQDKVSLLCPGYVQELADRVDLALKEAMAWAATREALCKDVECSSEQLNEVIDWVHFLNTECVQPIPSILGCAMQLRTLAPLINAASTRLEAHSVFLEDFPAVSQEMRALSSEVSQVSAAIEESSASLRHSISALKSRFDAVAAKRARRGSRMS